jgi:hypothetical protein
MPKKAAAAPTMKIIASPRNVFLATGMILLILICIVPIWNSIALMQDVNYSYWVGNAVPFWTIILSLMIIALYGITILVFFSQARPQVQTEQTIMMIANIFITLLGMTLMLASLPLSRQSVETYNNLMHRCDYSEQTHRTYEYAQVLQNIRATPECASKYSVEECQGYEDAAPYTSFLKAMEHDFRCSGFCYRSPASLLQATAVASNNVTASNGSLLGQAAGPRKHQDHVTALALLEKSGIRSEHTIMSRIEPANRITLNEQLGSNFMEPEEAVYPPTLFSDANYQATCEGMAARDMKNFAGDIGFQTFYQGIYLILIAIATSFLKLLGFCVRKEKLIDNVQNYGSANHPADSPRYTQSQHAAVPVAQEPYEQRLPIPAHAQSPRSV